jgi:chromosome segregation ATPase
MFWHRNRGTTAVRVDKEVLASFSASRKGTPNPEKVSELRRAHAECELTVRDLQGSLEAARRELVASKSRVEELEARHRSLLDDHRQLLAGRKRLEDRVQDLPRRLAEIKANGGRGGPKNSPQRREGGRADAA